MEEVKIKNELGLKVYINGAPDLNSVPRDLMENFVYYFANAIREKEEKKTANRRYSKTIGRKNIY